MNPWWRWEKEGASFRCNLCGKEGRTPEWYRSNLDANGDRRDRLQRPELCRGTVDYVAPPRYYRRCRFRRPYYLFLVDVGPLAYLSGFIHSTVHALRYTFREMGKRNPHARVAVLTYDPQQICFFRVRTGRGGLREAPIEDDPGAGAAAAAGVSGGGGGAGTGPGGVNGFMPQTPQRNHTGKPETTTGDDTAASGEGGKDRKQPPGRLLPDPHLILMTDMEEPFLPCPTQDLMLRPANRSSLQLLEATLDVIQQHFAAPSRMNTAPAEARTERGTAASAILAAGKTLMGRGGRILVFQSSLTQQGPGKLMNRLHPSFDLQSNSSLLPEDERRGGKAQGGAAGAAAAAGGVSGGARQQNILDSAQKPKKNKNIFGSVKLDRRHLDPEEIESYLLHLQNAFYER